MRLLGALGVLCLVATPAFGGATVYTFDITGGGIDLALAGTETSTAATMSGTFDVTIYASDGHNGESDTLLIGAAGMTNSNTLKLGLGGIATAYVYMDSVRFVDFMPEGPDHIGPGGVTQVDTDVVLEVTAFVTGVTSTTLLTTVSAGEYLPFSLTLDTSLAASDTMNAVLGFAYQWIIPIEGALTITLDLLVNLEATAHVVPDPAFGGLTALGLGAAGFWMRKRR